MPVGVVFDIFLVFTSMHMRKVYVYTNFLRFLLKCPLGLKYSWRHNLSFSLPFYPNISEKKPNSHGGCSINSLGESKWDPIWPPGTSAFWSQLKMETSFLMLTFLERTAHIFLELTSKFFRCLNYHSFLQATPEMLREIHIFHAWISSLITFKYFSLLIILTE